MSNLQSIYQILRAIDISYEMNNFDLEITLSLSKLKISERRLLLLLENLYNIGYLEGIKVKFGADGNSTISSSNPRLTLRGLEYLEENSFMKKAYRSLKEIRGWIPSLSSN